MDGKPCRHWIASQGRRPVNLGHRVILNGVCWQTLSEAFLLTDVEFPVVNVIIVVSCNK